MLRVNSPLHAEHICIQKCMWSSVMCGCGHDVAYRNIPHSHMYRWGCPHASCANFPHIRITVKVCSYLTSFIKRPVFVYHCVNGDGLNRFATHSVHFSVHFFIDTMLTVETKKRAVKRSSIKQAKRCYV